MNQSKEPRRYEDAAERVSLEVWRCKKCAAAYLAGGQGAEALARSCCCEDKPCAAPGCTGRVLGRTSRTLCEACEGADRSRLWQERLAKKGVDWDGQTPLCEADGDRFFFSDTELQDWFSDRRYDERGEGREPLQVADLRLVLCEKDKPPRFDVKEFLQDSLSEEGCDGLDDKACSAIERQVDEWVKDNAPESWHPTGTPVRPESLGLVVEDEPGAPGAAEEQRRREEYERGGQR